MKFTDTNIALPSFDYESISKRSNAISEEVNKSLEQAREERD